MRNIIYTILSTVLVFLACSETAKTSKEKNKIKTDFTKQQYAPDEYVKWVQGEEYPLNKEKQIDELIFSVQYKPHEYIICQEERTNEIPDSILKQKISEIEDMEYYDLKIELENGTQELLKYGLTETGQYDDRVKYFAFSMQKDIQLVLDGKDSIPCGLYHFERAYDVVPFVKVMLGFPTTDKKISERTLVFHDKVFNKGIIKFQFTKEELQNVPQLKTL